MSLMMKSFSYFCVERPEVVMKIANQWYFWDGHPWKHLLGGMLNCKLNGLYLVVNKVGQTCFLYGLKCWYSRQICWFI